MSVIPFPITKRRGFAERQARTAASYSSQSGERYIQRQLNIQAEMLRRRGVADGLIAREMRALETAIRAELSRLVMSYDHNGGDAA
jgi:hypothetical protein